MANTHKYLLFLARRSAITTNAYQRRLEEEVYADLPAWQKFLALALLSLGLGLMVSGLIYLLAFNWDDLDKTTKLGLAVSGVVLPAVLSLTPLFSPFTKRLLLSSAAFMVGGLFAVFGQIYQTGADNYEYFLAWFVFTTVWALAVDFPALWIIWLTVANLTLFFYGEQVLNDWRTFETLGVQTVLNGLAVVAFTFIGKRRKQPYPTWFLNSVALGVGTLGVSAIILTTWRDSADSVLYLVRFGTLGIFVVSLFVAYLQRWLGLLSVMALAIIVSIAALIIALDVEEATILLAGVWVLAGTTLAAVSINTLRKRWLDEEADLGAAAGAKEGWTAGGTKPTHLAINEGQAGGLLVGETIVRAEGKDLPPAEHEADYQVELREQQNLGIQLLSIFGGLIAMITLLGFLALVGALDSDTSRGVIGLVLIVTGIGLDRIGHQSFLDALLVSGVTMGIFLLLSVYIESFSSDTWAICSTGFLICTVLLGILKNKLLQVLMVCGMHTALVTLLVDGDQVGSLQTYLLATGAFLTCWILAESRIVTKSKFLAERYIAIQTGTVLALLMAATLPRYFYYSNGLGQLYLEDLPILELLIPVILYVAYDTIRDLKTDNWPTLGYVAGLALLLIPFIWAPAAAPALLVLVLSFKVSFRLGATLGTTALLYFIGQYYYDLNLTLLVKAGVLAGTGVFFLIAYAAIRDKLVVHEANY